MRYKKRDIKMCSVIRLEYPAAMHEDEDVDVIINMLALLHEMSCRCERFELVEAAESIAPAPGGHGGSIGASGLAISSEKAAGLAGALRTYVASIVSVIQAVVLSFAHGPGVARVCVDGSRDELLSTKISDAVF